MLDRIQAFLKSRTWRLQGYDTFSGEWYSYPGQYFGERWARWAARRRLKELERSQPSRYSGGQQGIQDQVYIVAPDGSMYRYNPGSEDH